VNRTTSADFKRVMSPATLAEMRCAVAAPSKMLAQPGAALGIGDLVRRSLLPRAAEHPGANEEQDSQDKEGDPVGDVVV
jgi:hypothetical protein